MKSKTTRKAVVLAMTLSLLMTINGICQKAQVQEAQAATIKISTKSANLKVGQTKKLSLKNTKKKAVWKSSNKSVATVSKSGKVKAKAKGTATITAKLNGKSYSCKVTVRELTASETLTKVHNAVKEAYGDNYRPNMKLDSLYLQEVIGLNSNTYDAVIAEGPLMSAQVDMFIGVHAVSGKRAEVETALKAYQSYLINDSFQYPMNMPKIQASRVITKGDYVFFILLGKNNDEEISEAKLLTYYKAQSELGASAITKAMGN